MSLSYIFAHIRQSAWDLCNVYLLKVYLLFWYHSNNNRMPAFGNTCTFMPLSNQPIMRQIQVKSSGSFSRETPNWFSKLAHFHDINPGIAAGVILAGLNISETADLLKISLITVSKVYTEWCKKIKSFSEQHLLQHASKNACLKGPASVKWKEVYGD